MCGLVDEYLCTKSAKTRKIYASYIERFCRSQQVTVEAFAAMAPNEALRVSWAFLLQEIPAHRRTAQVMQSTLKGLYEYAWGGARVLPFRSRRHGMHYIRYVRNGDKHTPSKTEVYKVADCAGSLKGTAIVLTLFQGGMRPNALCSLNYGHVRGPLEARQVPLRLKITAQLDSKMLCYELDFYYTWLQGEAVEALRAYVAGKRWTDGTPLFASASGRRYTSKDLHFLVKRWMRKAGLDTTRTSLYGLRKAFYNVLVKSGMSDPFREALMGHKLQGSRGNYFDRHDLDALEREYMTANFGRHVDGRTVTVLREELALYRETAALLNDPGVRRVLLALRDPARVRRLLDDAP